MHERPSPSPLIEEAVSQLRKHNEFDQQLNGKQIIEILNTMGGEIIGDGIGVHFAAFHLGTVYSAQVTSVTLENNRGIFNANASARVGPFRENISATAEISNTKEGRLKLKSVTPPNSFLTRIALKIVGHENVQSFLKFFFIRRSFHDRVEDILKTYSTTKGVTLENAAFFFEGESLRVVLKSKQS